MDRTGEEIFTALLAIYVFRVPEPRPEPPVHCCLDGFNTDGFWGCRQTEQILDLQQVRCQCSESGKPVALISAILQIAYHRRQDEAQRVLNIVTSVRSYDAYSQCLKALPNAGVLAYVSHQSLDRIFLTVKYATTQVGASPIKLDGIVTGGSVAGAPPGRLWQDGRVWTPHQEFTFLVDAAANEPETYIILQPEDGSSSSTVIVKRADATLQLYISGHKDVIVHSDVSTQSERTPDNNMVKGNKCANFAGNDSNGFCQSRTEVSYSVAAPYFLQNARSNCDGSAGCHWTYAGPATISGEDERTAKSFILNWGVPVRAVLLVDEWEHLDKTSCGTTGGPVPVVGSQAVIFEIPRECLSIATLRWVYLPRGSQGSMKFGDERSEDGRIVEDSKVPNESTVTIGYKVSR
jgi:hypothetical protein